MNFMERFYQLMAKGFATKEEKKELEDLVGDDENLKAKFAEVKELPEEDPKGDEASEDDVKKAVAELLKDAVAIESAKLKADFDQWKKDFETEAKTKSGMFAPEVKDKRAGMKKRFHEIMIALKTGDGAKLKDMSVGSDPDGGYTVDSELFAEIQHLMTEYGTARAEMFPVQLSKGDLKLNKLVADVAVNWTDEGVAKTSTSPTIGQETLTLKKLAAIVPMTDELLDDTEVDLPAFISGRVAENFSLKEDQAFFLGDGTGAFGGFTGVLIAVGVNEVTMTGATFASIDADDLIDMVDATPQGALRNGKYYLHRTIMSYIRKLKTTDGEYIYQRPSESGPATIWGYPVVLAEAFPSKTDTAADTAFVLFGDLRKAAWIGFKGSMAMDRSNQATITSTDGQTAINLWEQDMTALRFVNRVGYVLILPTAITRLVTAAASA